MASNDYIRHTVLMLSGKFVLHVVFLKDTKDVMGEEKEKFLVV